jgi:allophanate hydrolase subunit 1
METIISFNKVREKLIKSIESNEKLNDIQKDILETLTYSNPLWISDLGVRAILTKGENTIRLCTKNNKTVINIDIVYNAGSDLYDVKFYKLKGNFDVETKEFKDVFFDELYRLLQEQISKLIYGV